MDRRPGKRISGLLILAVVAFISIGLAAPLLVRDHNTSLVLNGGNVLASVGDSYVLTRPIELLASPRVVLERGKLSLIRSDGKTATVGRALIDMLTGSRATLQLDGADITIDVPQQDAPSIKTSDIITADTLTEHAPLVDAVLQRAFRTFRVHRSTITINIPNKTPLVLPRVSLAGSYQPTRAIEVSGNFDLKGQTTRFATNLRLPAAADTDTSFPVQFSASNALFGIKLNGAFATDDRYRFEAPDALLDIKNLPKTAALLDVQIPDRMGLKRLSASGRLTWVGSSVAFHDARITLADNSGTGTLSLALKGKRPLLDGTLAYEKLNLTAFRPLSDQTPVQPDKFMSMTWLSDLTATLSGGDGSLMREIDADLRLSSDRLIVGDTSFGRAAASLSLRDGRMLTDVVELVVDEQATGRGQLTVDTSGYAPRFKLRGTLESVRLGPIAEEMVGHQIVRGRGMVRVDLQSQGNNRTANLASLDGSIDIDMPAPATLALRLDQLRSTPKRGAARGSTGGWGAAADGDTSLDGLAAHLKATNGVIVLEQLMTKSAANRLAAYGTVIPADKTIDLRFWIAPRNDDAESAREALSGRATANGSIVHAKGSWTSPRIDVESLPQNATQLQ